MLTNKQNKHVFCYSLVAYSKQCYKQMFTSGLHLSIPGIKHRLSLLNKICKNVFLPLTSSAQRASLETCPLSSYLLFRLLKDRHLKSLSIKYRKLSRKLLKKTLLALTVGEPVSTSVCLCHQPFIIHCEWII